MGWGGRRTIRTSQSRIELSRELVRRYTSVMSTEVTSPTCAVSVRMLRPETVSQNRTCPSFELSKPKLAVPIALESPLPADDKISERVKQNR